ncbi:MAG TPA: succinylglutamate desuccinylase/aspartoacylase family protein [Methanobacteriaceae archaeon]|jgi:predicted deacylase|nr:succinylglutamate desuccinylase/aspartoacylase family protein [Euryarchaeota archaeon]HNR25786.1 succinylglutamate desuccinylase/aspartoacylase family protein [Methanobacteriaceae archaeon]HNS25065.1 succinylglutamate desuccinylase/aspartoacylase family protein [Methanobacteriaceae archaeon]
MNLEMTIISRDTGGTIEDNHTLMQYLINNPLTKAIVDTAKKGTPLLKLGKGTPRAMLISGIHGNELPPQISSIRLINEINLIKSRGTIYFIPFAIPKATMQNYRRFDGFDMNRSAFKSGTISNDILELLESLKIDALADFHSTQKNSNPGVQSIFCSKEPCYESFKMAKYMAQITSSKIICQEKAGTLFTGALEDEANLKGIPAVTCEVVSKNGWVDKGSPEHSYHQMRTFLDYVGVELVGLQSVFPPDP